MIMDTGRTTRKFPGYTTAQLEASIAEGITENRSVGIFNKMVEEVSARKACASIPFAVPQIKGGTLVFKVGRM